MRSLLFRYGLIIALTAVAVALKQPLGLEAYPFSLLYWVIVAGAWADDLRGGLFSVGLAIAIGSHGGASASRCFWFAAEAIAIVIAMAMRRQALVQRTSIQQQSAVKNDFFDKASHAMKGHITHMRLAIDLIQQKLNGAAAVGDLLNLLDQECEQLTALVVSILKVQELELNLSEVRYQPVSLGAWLDEQVQIYKSLGDRSNLQIVNEADDLQISTDPNLLEGIVSELLFNACKYTAPGGKIKLTTERTGKAIAITVANTSPDIPAENLERLFERFYRGRNDNRGSGLGLAIALKQAEVLGGTITAESSNGWVKFRVLLP
ncbi:HAMP domain-containing histidine kinase [Leptolyngbya sp. FACHB-541]|uniref:sensor histidine kinase n=1 Tax=Leptolyngbya sp. FACHB-541 TaxID=2692810 RepID=UPI00168A1DC2|nr:HAMP domain-containing sensor histidine kinase [Leptolyngbya sp. FACHB-541]MBD1995981.1 HAMP domain-containing histidine kinase [Leptolyngbya sp. FACHB-541]